MTEAACKACHDPLTLTLDPEESGDEGLTVPDDLVLPCGCHFHWQCLLDESVEVASSLSCPSCNSYLPSPASAPAGSSSASAQRPNLRDTPILTTYTNEGGMQEDLDIAPILFEEAFLASHPEARPARAFHTLAAEGDMQGMVELLRDLDENVDGDTPVNAAKLLVWRDPLNGERSALHVALEAQQEEVVWLLLWLGSAARTEDFPHAVVQIAQAMGLARRAAGSLPAEEDVRFVRDETGRTAGDVCLELGHPWTRLVDGGLFT